MSSSIFKRIMRLLKKIFGSTPFESSSCYWINRYAQGGNSGPGSYDHLAEFKAHVINEFVEDNCIKSIIEFGSGDGNQLLYARYPQYIGIDISQDAIDQCRKLFYGDKTKLFLLLSNYAGECCELSLSLDVIFHLIEEDTFNKYMKVLFESATRFVIIYSSNISAARHSDTPHVKHREFTLWIKNNVPNWKLIKFIKNQNPYNGDYKSTSFSDFYIYKNLRDE